MLDLLTTAPPMPATASPRATFDVTLSADADAPARIVRLATTTPFALVSMSLTPPADGRRSATLTVSAADRRSLATLRNRFERVVDVLAVRIRA